MRRFSTQNVMSHFIGNHDGEYFMKNRMLLCAHPFLLYSYPQTLLYYVLFSFCVLYYVFFIGVFPLLFTYYRNFTFFVFPFVYLLSLYLCALYSYAYMHDRVCLSSTSYGYNSKNFNSLSYLYQ